MLKKKNEISLHNLETAVGAAFADHVTCAKWPAHCKTVIEGTDRLAKQLT